ncbi:fructokinase [Saccharicrinis carchari]|uniref:Fructokinase n=1 Tax=Saccharicrinis carchari TaxID=1168039 RepID=A0A521DXV8_SACCC|nr:PfkB family carbohydrate kinase [Saccharicrinis carchari]SMO76553.1 fructokinase [Saccharicrinis carchari]
MRRVFGLGETVLDIVFKNGQPIAAKAGGSVLNALISLARMGHQCHFISELGHDKAGDLILDFIKENKVDTQYVQRYKQGQTALALAFLNEHNDAGYEFYKNYPSKRLTGPLPDFNSDDILLFGSSYAIAPAIRQQIYPIIKHAQQMACLILYDPNYRKKHDENQVQYLNYLKENIAAADIIRGSNEDFDNIYAATSSDQVFETIKNKCNNLIYTASAQGAYLHSKEFKKHYPVPRIKPVSTIGAGDNFNAGIIHALLANNITKKALQNLSENKWDILMNSGIKCATEVCLSLDNYVPEEFRV